MALGVRQLLVFRTCTYSNWWPFNLSFISIDFQVSRWRCQWQWLRRRQCRWRRWWARRELKHRIWKSRGREVRRIQVPQKGWCFQSKVYGALPNFKGNESRYPSSVLKSKTETSATTGGAAQGCSRIYMSGTWMRKDLFIVRRVKESRQKTSSWTANNCNPLISSCSSRTQSFFVSSR